MSIVIFKSPSDLLIEQEAEALQDLWESAVRWRAFHRQLCTQIDCDAELAIVATIAHLVGVQASLSNGEAIVKKLSSLEAKEAMAGDAKKAMAASLEDFLKKLGEGKK